MSLDVEVWALGRGGAPDVALPDLGDYSITPIAGDVGSVSIDYPRDGLRFAALRALVEEDRPVELEIRTDGTTANAVGALLYTAAGDDIKPGAVWTFTGYTLEVLLRRARTPHNTDPAQGGNEKGESSFSANAGVVMRTLMQRAQARGALLDVTYASFTNTHDSNGVPWSTTAAIVLAPGRDYADILATTLHANELCEWEVRRTGAGYELRLYNPGTRGVDRAIPGPGAVTLEHGRDLEDAPVKHDVSNVRTAITAAGKDGLVQSATNAGAAARLGYRVEGYLSFGDVADPGTLAAAVQLAAATAGDGESEHSHGLILESEGHPLPGREFGLSDWVLRAVNGRTARRRVVRYSLTRTGREVRAAVTLGDIISARAIRVQRAIDALTNGSTVVGAPAPPPDTDDGKAPAVPTGLTGTSRAYYDGGTPLAQVTATWLAVITNADGTAIGDLSGYEVQYRYLPGQAGNLSTDWQTAGITSATTLRWSPVVQDKAIELRVLAYDRYNRESAWSAVFPLTTAKDADAPPVASAAAPYSHLGLLLVPWDGKGSTGQAMPVDFEAAELHLSTSPVFTESRPLDGTGALDLSASTTYAGELRAAGELPVDIGASGYGTTFYARWVLRDRSGNASAGGAIGSAVLVRVADGDLAGLSVGKLLAGIINVVVGVGQRLYAGDPNGAGWEGDPAGFRFYTGTGSARKAVLEFIASTGVLTILGRILAGAGIGVGPTIDVNPSGPSLDLYPNATVQRVQLRALTGTDPNGTANVPQFQFRTLTAGGAETGAQLHTSPNDAWFFHRVANVLRGARLYLGGPGSTNGAILGYQDNTVGVDGSVRVNRNGQIVISSTEEVVLDSDVNVRTVEPLGSGGAGFSFKVQGLGDAGYRTVFDSGDNVIRFVDNASGNWVSDGAGGRKTFVIPHPVDPDRWLVHVATESPEALVEYHGDVVLVDGAAVVELPAYFEALTDPDRRTVQATMLLPDEPLVRVVESPPPPADMPGAARPPVALPEHEQVRPVAASRPREGRFRVACPAPDGTRVAWHVIAARRGEPVDVEPHHDDVNVHGDGPYRYLTRRETT